MYKRMHQPWGGLVHFRFIKRKETVHFERSPFFVLGNNFYKASQKFEIGVFTMKIKHKNELENK